MNNRRTNTVIEPSTSVPLVIGVTGHRDLVDEELPMLKTKIKAFLFGLAKQFPDLPLHIITPLAEGADRLVANVALGLGMTTTVLLPMPEKIYKEDFDEPSKLEFNQLLARLMENGELVELSLLSGSSASDVAHEGAKRDAQYEYLGVYLAAHSHILLALWDGKPSAAPGGTAHVVQFHQTDEVEILAGQQHRSPIDFSEDESDLVYHITCSRQIDGGPATGLQPGSTSWLCRDDLTPRSSELPIRYHTVFERHASLNRDLAASSVAGGDEGLADFAAAPNRHQLSDVHTLYQRVDQLAIRFQTYAKRAMRWMFGFVALTGISFILYADFSGLDFGIYLYLIFMSFAVGLYVLERRGDWYRKYLDYRVLAEGLRVQFYWAMAGVRSDNPSHFSHDNFMKRQDLELGWIRNVMRHAGRRSDAAYGTVSEVGLRTVIKAWVGSDTTGQTGYYRKRARERTKRVRYTEWLGTVSFSVGLLVAAVLAFSVGALRSDTQNILIALMGTLPFLAAVRQSYTHRVAERELVAQYTYMERIFSNAYRLLARASNDDERRDILRALGDAAMDENGLWILRQRERPLSSGQVFQTS